MGTVFQFQSWKVMEPKPKTFGDWLREKRTAARLSLDDVAGQVGVSKQRLSDIENNKRRTKGGQLPKLREDKIDAIAHAVFAPVEEARLAAGLSPRRTTGRDLQETMLLSRFGELSDDKKETALAVIETLWRQQDAKRRADRQQTKAMKKRTVNS